MLSYDTARILAFLLLVHEREFFEAVHV